LNPHRDEIVARLTEERVPSVNHEVVPDYFRTKPDPAVEALQKELNKDSKFKKLNSNDLRELILTSNYPYLTFLIIYLTSNDL